MGVAKVGAVRDLLLLRRSLGCSKCALQEASQIEWNPLQVVMGMHGLKSFGSILMLMPSLEQGSRHSIPQIQAVREYPHGRLKRAQHCMLQQRTWLLAPDVGAEVLGAGLAVLPYAVLEWP